MSGHYDKRSQALALLPMEELQESLRANFLEVYELDVVHL
jgi:hypothetical protein